MSVTSAAHHRNPISLRTRLVQRDLPAIRSLLESTAMFNIAEVEIAVEIIFEYLGKGAASGYHFIVAEVAGEISGYACFGPIPCTLSSWDLYWIAVHPTLQRSGIGRQLLSAVETSVGEAQGTNLFVDTSGRKAYAPTRLFYERMGYDRAAVLPDFYAPGDPKVIYAKSLIVGD